jgi:hypothetical protein
MLYFQSLCASVFLCVQALLEKVCYLISVKNTLIIEFMYISYAKKLMCVLWNINLM